MSTLQVANVFFESTQNNAIQYTGSNTVLLKTAGVTRITANSTGIFGAPSTTANSVVFLDSAGKLPAVDGSALTNIASNTDIWTGTSNTVFITPFAMMKALGEVSLTDAANVNIDFVNGINFNVTLAGNRLLVINTVSSSIVGRSGYIKVIQDATGSRTMTFTDTKISTINGENPILSTGANAVDFLSYTIANTTSIVMSLMRNLL